MRGQAFKLPSAVGLFLATSISLARAGTDPLDLVQGGRPIKGWIADLDSKSSFQRDYAAEQLGKIGPIVIVYAPIQPNRGWLPFLAADMDAPPTISDELLASVPPEVLAFICWHSQQILTLWVQSLQHQGISGKPVSG